MAAFIQGREEEPFGLSVISVSELLHGVHRANSKKRRLKRSAYVEKIIELFPIYPFDLTAARNLCRNLGASAGERPADRRPYLLIASTAIVPGVFGGQWPTKGISIESKGWSLNGFL